MRKRIAKLLRTAAALPCRACGQAAITTLRNVDAFDFDRLTKSERAELSRLLNAAFQFCPVCGKPQPNFETVPTEDLDRCLELFRKMHADGTTWPLPPNVTETLSRVGSRD